jgi:polysaccharide deacetylase 2 family uncharacterized protein YibQ
MSPRKKRAARKKPQPKAPTSKHHLKLALAGLFLVGFLLLGLVILSSVQQPPQQPEVAPPVVQAPNLEQLVQDVQVELESAMLRSGASLKQFKVSQDDDARRLEVDGIYPERQILVELSRRLHRLAPDLELLLAPNDNRLIVQKGSKLLFTLQFAPVRAHPPQVVAVKPRIAIIMDDLGRDIHLAQQAIALDQQLTMAILPNERHASEIATLAHRRGREVMIHIPMEPEGYPAANPGEGALFVSLSDQEIQRRFLTYLDRIPYAVGGNNHMGSKFTTYPEGMRAVLAIMRQEGLFFVDSKTSGDSVALAEARRMKVPATSRDVFLDNDADVELIARQIRKLVVLAGKHGKAVGICHPYPETIAALQQELPQLNRDGITVVPVSELISR